MSKRKKDRGLMERYDEEDDVREIGAPNDSNDIGLLGRSDRFPVFVAFFRPQKNGRKTEPSLLV